MNGQGQTLYNGIELATCWPPGQQALSREPMPVPYLDSPPYVIPIDVGRQLFVDDCRKSVAAAMMKSAESASVTLIVASCTVTVPPYVLTCTCASKFSRGRSAPEFSYPEKMMTFPVALTEVYVNPLSGVTRTVSEIPPAALLVKCPTMTESGKLTKYSLL